jgi:hypothetical protein
MNVLSIIQPEEAAVAPLVVARAAQTAAVASAEVVRALRLELPVEVVARTHRASR